MTCSGTPSAQACYSTQVLEDRGARGGPEMQIVGALDVHRSQITTMTLDVETGEVRRGRISPAAREPLRQWLERASRLPLARFRVHELHRRRLDLGLVAQVPHDAL